MLFYRINPESIFRPLSFVACSFLFMSLLVLLSGACISQTTDLYRDFECDVGITSDALKIARGEVGIKEKGQNRGEVEKYQRLVGNPIGSPYCYSGIYWCFEQSSVKLKKKNPLLRTGLASAGRIYLEKYAVTSKKIGQIGLIFWQYPRKSTGHVEFYFKRLSGGWVQCVGFNTGGNNPREGGGVKITRRNIQHPLARIIVKRCISFV